MFNFMNRNTTVQRRAIKELNALSDRELNDLGIARGEIRSVVFGEFTRN